MPETMQPDTRIERMHQQGFDMPLPARFTKESFAAALAQTRTQDPYMTLDRILEQGSKSFNAASKLLPAKMRKPAAALYAFCRIADDAVDESDDPIASLNLLRRRLDRIYNGRPTDHIVDRAFADTVAEYRIPKEIVLALFEGFAWDNGGRVYITLDDTLDYCARVASTVGVMMTLLMGSRDPEVLARACDLGLAMQLTNICRDVGEDADNGRIYLPRAWLTEAGIDPELFLAHPRYTEALGDVVRRLLAVAEEHYRRADIGISRLPPNARTAIRAARLIYSDIGREIEKNRYNSVTVRAHTGGMRKVWLAIRSLGARFWRPKQDSAPPHPSARFLVDAVATDDTPPGLTDQSK